MILPVVMRPPSIAPHPVRTLPDPAAVIPTPSRANRRHRWPLLATALTLLGAGPAATQPAASVASPSGPRGAGSTRVHVDARQAGAPADGRSWATAFPSLPAALALPGVGEIWVARGTYRPTTGSDRTATFQMRAGVALYGGFAGGETRLDQRDWAENPTILSGDIGQPDDPRDNVHHVVTGASDAVLDGFTITGGHGLGGPGGPRGGGRPPGKGPGGPPGRGGRGGPIHVTPQGILSGANAGSGGGMINFQAAPIVRNCIFEANQAGKGGAVYNMTSTRFPPRPDAADPVPVFINCIFRHNTAQGRGGAVSNDLGTAPIFLNCVFADNTTPQKGGGMYNDFGCSPTLINCLFTGNRAQSAGGMGNDGGSSPVLYFCTFTRNHAVDYGAPLYQGTGPASNPALISCQITANTCDWGDPGVYNWHDNTPRIEETADSGYRSGRFTADQLPELLRTTARHRAPRAAAPTPAAPAKLPVSTRLIYVNASVPTPGDGRSWATAYASLPAALADAGPDGAEVRVAAGTYRLGPDRSESFVLQPGVRLMGGFTGRDAERDPARNATVLDGNGAYHVLIGANGAVLDGFTLTGGHADGPGYDGKGGGLIAYQRGPQARPNAEAVTGFALEVRHCTFTANYARDGGAVYSYDRAQPVFTACRFLGNRAENGGAVLDRVGVTSTFTGCEFTGNTARWRGGATYFDYGSRPQMTDCVFRDNRTDGHGGAIFSVSRASQLENTRVTLTGCRFEGNRAGGDGGAAAFCDSSISVVQDCSFASNQAGRSGPDLYRDESSAAASGGRPR